MKQDFSTQDGALSFLSSFWSSALPEIGFIQGLSRSCALETSQVYQSAAEIINTSSIKDTPLYHREMVLPLILLESEMSIGPLPIRYGGGAVHGEQPAGTIYREGEIFEYGGDEKFAVFYYWPLPEGVESLGSVISEKLINPWTLLALDRDFITIEDRIIAFDRNPFTTGDFPIRASGDDRAIVAWASEVHFDYHYLYRCWGYPFFPDQASSEAFRAFCQTIFALYADGPSRLRLDAFVAAMARQPIVLEDEETVQEVEVFRGQHVIVTDQNVYRVPGSIPLRGYVQEGTVLKGGSPLTQVTRVDDVLSDPAWWQTESGMTLDRGMQHPDYFGGPLFFQNGEVQATIHGTESARFQIYGDDVAVSKFWEKVDLGSPDGTFLGTELWKKHGITDLNGDPDFDSPLLINPMGFLVNDILGVNIIGVRVRGDLLQDVGEFLKSLENLRRGTTPMAALVFFIDYELSEEYDPPADADELELAMGMGIYEEATDFSGAEQILNAKQSISR